MLARRPKGFGDSNEIELGRNDSIWECFIFQYDWNEEERIMIQEIGWKGKPGPGRKYSILHII